MRNILRLFALAIALGMPVSGAAQTAPRPDADPRIEKIVAAVSEERLQELLTKLVSFGTRNTLSDQESPTQGIGAARNWILEEMRRSSEKLQGQLRHPHHPAAGPHHAARSICAT